MNMDSPSLHSATVAHLPQSRARAYSNLSNHSGDHRIHKQLSSPHLRGISTSQSERLYRLAAENQANDLLSNSAVPFLTPQHSPVPSNLSTDQSIGEPLSGWSNIPPSPPRSDSGIPPSSLDLSHDDLISTTLSAPQDFTSLDHPTAPADMSSSLGFLLPSQYGGGLYETEPESYAMDQTYMPPLRMTQSGPGGMSAFSHTATSSPAMYQSSLAQRRPGEMPTSSPASFDPNATQITSNPYDSPSSGSFTMAPSQSIASLSGATLPSPPMSSSGTPMMHQYGNAMSRSPNLYDQGMYNPNFTTAPAATQLYASSHSMSYPPAFVGSSVNDVLGKPMGNDAAIRVINQRPKPQCWEHGCNGRQFSTFSNLLRHQREKSGTASKSYCPKCGAEFTRTTARNGHLAHDKCTKQRRASDAK